MMKIVACGDGLVLAARNGYMFRSTDSGETWDNLGVFGGATPLFIVWHGEHTNVYGETFGVALAGCQDGTLWQSTDWGATWAQVQDIGDYPGDAVVAMENLGLNPETDTGRALIVTYSGHIWRSDFWGLAVVDCGGYDQGGGWLYSYDRYFSAFAYNEVNNDVVGAARPHDGYTYATMYTDSVGAGAAFTKWQDLDTTSQINTIEYIDDDIFLAGAEDGSLYRTEDKGHHWTKILDLGIAINDILYTVYGVVFLGADSDTVYRSLDFGETWEEAVTLGEGVTSIESLTFDDDETMVLAATGPDGKVFRALNMAEDAGLTDDWNPAIIVKDLLTNTRYGAGIPAEYLDLDSFTEQRLYWAEKGYLISVYLDSQKSVLEWCEYILSHCGGFLYRQGNKIYLGAWKSEDPIGTITRDDLAVDDEENVIPITISERKMSETFNHVEVQWEDREDLYNTAIAKAVDDVDIRTSNQRRRKTVKMGGIKTPEVAELVKWRLLIDSMYRFNTYAFRLGPKSQLVQCGKVYTLSDGFKVSNARVRITKILETERATSLEIEAVDDISDLYPDLSGWSTTPINQRDDETVVDPDDLVVPTTAYREDWDVRMLHLSFAAQSVYTQGVLLFVSRDGNTYNYIDRVTLGELTGGSGNVAGTILSDLDAAKAPTWRGDESFLVSVGTVGDLATDITDQQFFNNQKLAKIGDEIIAYKTCEETDTEGTWRITGVIRGLYQTEPVAHAAGETFATLILDYSWIFNDSDIGRTLYFKAIPYYETVGGNLANVDAVEIPIRGHYKRPNGVALVRLTSDENDVDAAKGDYTGDTFTVYWNLCSQTAGFNVGPQDGGGTWQWGDSESELVAQNGIPWGVYTADPEIQNIDVVFRDEAGTLISQRTIAVASSVEVSKADDLDGENPAEIEIWPRYALRAIREESVTVDDGS